MELLHRASMNVDNLHSYAPQFTYRDPSMRACQSCDYTRRTSKYIKTRFRVASHGSVRCTDHCYSTVAAVKCLKGGNSLSPCEDALCEGLPFNVAVGSTHPWYEIVHRRAIIRHRTLSYSFVATTTNDQWGRTNKASLM